MDVAALIERMRSRADYAGQLAHVEVLAERPGRFAAPRVARGGAACAAARRSRGIERLYSHQVAAWRRPAPGRTLVVVTGTASGKTLCYNLPILEAALADARPARCTSFPPRRSPRINSRVCWNWSAATRNWPRAIRPGVYDGDTPTAQRRRIRGEANLVLSNPDMLHAAILPYHPQVGRAVCRAAVRGRRRGAHLSRHPRGARVGRAAAARAGVRALWFAARVSGRQRHDRQPRRARPAG